MPRFYMYKEPDLTPEITTLIELIRINTVISIC